MNEMNRRHFLQTTAGAAAALIAAPQIGGAIPSAPFAIEKRSLGKTGLTPTRLGFGTGVRAWNKTSDMIKTGEANFVGTLRHAYDRGIRFFDLADQYGSHPYLAKAKREGNMPREELTILTKSNSKDADGMRADLERFRQEIDTDYIDVVLLHCMTSADWNVKLRGAMDVLEEAKQQGIIKAHGVSCHDWGAMQTAVEEPWTDVMLSRINPYGVKMDNTPEKVVELLTKAHAKGIGQFGMKINGEGALTNRLDLSMKFVLNLGCIDAITIGVLSTKEVDDNIDRIQKALAA